MLINRRLLVFSFLPALVANTAFAATWLPITEEEKASTSCSFDPDAGAEVLYKSITMDDENPTASYRQYYLRIKIYDERGAESVSKFRMNYHTASSRLGSHYARIVKPSGEVREIDKSEFYDQKVESDGFDSFRAKVFSLPKLEPGDIVDLKYRINLHDYYYSPELLVEFQEAWPLRRADIRVRPAEWVEQYSHIKWMTSKCDAKAMKKKADGFYELTVENFPAQVHEPHQQAKERQVAWLLFYMTHDGKSGDGYWKQEGIKLYKEMIRLTKPGELVKEAVAKATAGTKDEVGRLQAIYDYCRSSLVNSLHGEADRLSPEDRDNIKGDAKAEKILEQGYGNPHNINIVFCAMAREAGFDARLTALNSHSTYGFSKILASIDATMRNRCIAVELDGEWTFFDPGGKYLDFGQLDWEEQGVAALIGDRKRMELQLVRYGSAGTSLQKSAANVELSEKGTLWGKLSFEFTGQIGVSLKRVMDGMSAESREDFVKEILNDRWPDVSITKVAMTDPADPFEPLKVDCEASWSSYADAIGSRLFFNVNVFQVAEEPEFPESERVSDVFLRYPKTEIDEVEIKLPDGFALEEASAPKPFDVENVVDYSPRLALNKKSNTLIYSRTFKLHGIQYPVKYYELVKGVFDAKHKEDQHSIALKKSEVEVSSL